MDPLFTILFVFGAGSFLTWWFLKGLLNPFIEAAVGIVITGLFTVVSFFLSPFIWIARMIYRLFQRIFAPAWVKITVFGILGAEIFILDHFYNTKIYAEDETTFYRVVFLEKTYWITLQAIQIGGFFLFVAGMYFLGVILKGLNWLLDRPIHISIVVQK